MPVVHASTHFRYKTTKIHQNPGFCCNNNKIFRSCRKNGPCFEGALLTPYDFNPFSKSLTYVKMFL